MKTIEESGKVSFPQAVKDFWKGYADFRGRSTRAGYWWANLCIALIYVILFIIMSINAASRSYYESSVSPVLLFIIVIFSLALVVPMLALTVRRLRDVGLKSKAILALMVVYYGLYLTFMLSFYSSFLSSITSMLYQYSDSYSAPTMMSSSSPLFIFLFMTLATFVSVCPFLPTNMLATKSKNPILNSIFSSAYENIAE